MLVDDLARHIQKKIVFFFFGWRRVSHLRKTDGAAAAVERER